ncbi:MAG: hypothetical protein QOH13_497, partial [Thermoleophilaceae bacterium]|nr:hypothetical protein [Thermoleophilaceae bacterium]
SSTGTRFETGSESKRESSITFPLSTAGVGDPG